MRHHRGAVHFHRVRQARQIKRFWWLLHDEDAAVYSTRLRENQPARIKLRIEMEDLAGKALRRRTLPLLSAWPRILISAPGSSIDSADKFCHKGEKIPFSRARLQIDSLNRGLYAWGGAGWARAIVQLNHGAQPDREYNA
jgi:hypothetical protein